MRSGAPRAFGASLRQPTAIAADEASAKAAAPTASVRPPKLRCPAVHLTTRAPRHRSSTRETRLPHWGNVPPDGPRRTTRAYHLGRNGQPPAGIQAPGQPCGRRPRGRRFSPPRLLLRDGGGLLVCRRTPAPRTPGGTSPRCSRRLGRRASRLHRAAGGNDDFAFVRLTKATLGQWVGSETIHLVFSERNNRWHRHPA